MHLDLTKNSFPCSSTPILQNHTNQSNLSLQDHHTVPGLWMAQSGRTPHTKTCQAEHSCLPKPKLHPLTASITAGQGVTLSCLGWGEQSCGLAPGAARAPSSPCCWSLPALTWSPSSSATKTSVHTCARSQLLTCTCRCIYAHPPPKT